ncbi:RHS repeat-associated core domain-containing protein [Pseudomonas helleri]|nr:RHS repeat-associated core domain-containing protein [Pseudomonas helleri]MCU1753871.1 RHS repeat-associated core domain-containing protein [Pseudomonas helleri]
MGFNGERRAPVTGHYLLGQGYRAYNPVLMRFNSPDTLSPFNKGGINSYAYCLGDPVNLIDTDGHSAASLIAIIFRNIPAYDQVPRLNIVHHAAANAAPVVAPLGRARFGLQGHHSLALVPADRAPVVTVSTSRAAAAIEAPIAMVRASTSRSAQGAAAAPAPIASTSRAASAVAAQNTSSAEDFFRARAASRTRQAAAARSAPAPAPQPLPEADTQEAASLIRGAADLW